MHVIFGKSTGMKKAILIHNSTAGDGDHKKGELIELIRENGYEPVYFSTDIPFWERFTKEDAEVIFVAGGDGTVQKLAKAMLEAKEEKIREVPVRILPYGTANNIATTLNLQNPEQQSLSDLRKVNFDVGVVEGKNIANFFIEGIGCGIFPKLVEVMNSKSEEEKKDEIKQSLSELLQVIENYEAREAIIIADEREITGKFLLIELMNIKLIGPNIELAPDADTGDGQFELVMVREEAREDLKSFIQNILNETISDNTIDKFAERLKGNNFRLKWKGDDVHIDDEILEDYQGEELVIKNRQAVFQFYSY